jgi:hypothetical protein
MKLETMTAMNAGSGPGGGGALLPGLVDQFVPRHRVMTARRDAVRLAGDNSIDVQRLGEGTRMTSIRANRRLDNWLRPVCRVFLTPTRTRVGAVDDPGETDVGRPIACDPGVREVSEREGAAMPRIAVAAGLVPRVPCRSVRVTRDEARA